MDRQAVKGMYRMACAIKKHYLKYCLFVIDKARNELMDWKMFEVGYLEWGS